MSHYECEKCGMYAGHCNCDDPFGLKERSRATTVTDPVTAYGFLEQASREMGRRASTYDKPEGERSMGKTVAAFNALTGHKLTEQEGWQFMELLKIARSNQGGYRADSFVDGAAYAALAGEAAAREKKAGD